ncbi:hypothetical protein M885DRAFT_564102 [Pelagophyceae sp. CCMP2097]|nr:hypothetical protein M885DRAFT_564102 [Pelagophyceae sp. CCMP2097]
MRWPQLLDVAMMEFAPGLAIRTARCRCAAVRVDLTNAQPRVVVIGGETLTTRDSDEDDDNDEEEEEEDETIYFSSTEPLRDKAATADAGADAVRASM